MLYDNDFSIIFGILNKNLCKYYVMNYFSNLYVLNFINKN